MRPGRVDPRDLAVDDGVRAAHRLDERLRHVGEPPRQVVAVSRDEPALAAAHVRDRAVPVELDLERPAARRAGCAPPGSRASAGTRPGRSSSAAVVVALDQQPVLLLPVEVRRDERPAAVQPRAVEARRSAGRSASPRGARRCRVSQISTVPAPYSPLRDLAVEGRVLERVILDVDGERPRARLERHALRHRPRGERAVPLEAEVVVEPPGVVALDDENRQRELRSALEIGSGVLLGSRFRRYSSRLTCIHNDVYRPPQGKEAPEACLPDGGLGARGPLSCGPRRVCKEIVPR